MSETTEGHAPQLLTELEPASPEVRRYHRQKLTAGLVSLLLSFSVLLVFALWLGPVLARELSAWVGEGRWLQLVAVAAILGVATEAFTLPVEFYSGFVLEHRYRLSNQSFGRWARRKLKGYAVGAVLGLPLLLGFYALLWLGGPWWWVWATAGWLAVTLVLGRLAPVLILPLFYKIHRLDDESLRHRLERIAEGTGLKLEGVYRMELSAETKKANAALTGLGKSRRVLLGDTLLAEFTPEEIEVVFAHEVGHHVYKHLPKMIAWSTVTTVVGFYLVDLLLHTAAPALGYGSFTDPAALPLISLVLTAFGLTLVPLQNYVSRVHERQCDRYALDRTGLRDAYRSAFIKLARLNKSQPDPNPWVVWLFYDHPPIRERVAMAG